MMFVGNNIVSVDSAPTGAPDITIIEVSMCVGWQTPRPPRRRCSARQKSGWPRRSLEGVDLEVTLGMSYLSREMVRADPVTVAP